MLIKIFPHGEGDPFAATRYLLAQNDASGRVRPVVDVLRGDPAMVARVAASLGTVHRFTSGVIAWAPEDKPTPNEMDEVLDAFERFAFAGLDLERVSYTFVSHGDHVHFLVARCVLDTGKAMNIAPPGSHKKFDHLRNHFNHLKGWARPDDPTRARLVQHGGAPKFKLKRQLTKIEKTGDELGMSVSDVLMAQGFEPDLKQVIYDDVLSQVHEGVVKNRADVLACLAQYGVVTRANADFISIKANDGGQSMRFRGEIFKADFDATQVLRQSPISDGDLRSEPDLVAAEISRIAMEQEISARAEYNKSRYPPPAPKPESASVLPVESQPFQRPAVQEVLDERDFADFDEEDEPDFRTVWGAYRRFISACRSAVSAFDSAVRAVFDAKRAGDFAEQAGLDAERASGKIAAYTRRMSIFATQAEKVSRPRGP